MRVFVTGAAGMMGTHLLDFLAEKEISCFGIDIRSKKEVTDINSAAQFEVCDVRDLALLEKYMIANKPDIVFHLAAQPHPLVSWKRPQYTSEVNIIGTINVFEIVKKHFPNAVIINACSSAEYGYIEPSEVPVSESKPLRPLHPYGVTKVAQELLACQYWHNFNVKSVSLRIFNTTGTRKVNDACSDWARQIAKIEKGLQEPVLKVGNLTTQRAITDVRDLIQACWLAATKGAHGGAYNVSGEKVYRMSDVIDTLKKNSRVPFTLFQDPSLVRPSDEPVIYGNSKLFQDKTGWKQQIPLEKTLKDMLEYWRTHNDPGRTYE